IVLVGDSVANVVQGRTNTLGVTIDEMVYHTKIVARRVKRALLTADMPFMSYQVSKEEAIRNAGRLVKEANAEAVKLEVNEEHLETVYAIYKAGIPVMGHIGLCPQSIHVMGGYRVQGRGEEESARLLNLAKAVEEKGAFSIVLESIPSSLAERITESIGIPTIGIGAGPHCDGQVMVINDLIGLTEEPLPRFVKRFANVRETVLRSVAEFSKEVREGSFPGPEHCYD
ncbi:MAG: 3-methyl-2-oxobutanoate hydroxymethyltransferase, partial [Candidatus Methanosuratincola sp.]